MWLSSAGSIHASMNGARTGGCMHAHGSLRLGADEAGAKERRAASCKDHEDEPAGLQVRSDFVEPVNTHVGCWCSASCSNSAEGHNDDAAFAVRMCEFSVGVCSSTLIKQERGSKVKEPTMKNHSRRRLHPCTSYSLPMLRPSMSAVLRHHRFATPIARSHALRKGSGHTRQCSHLLAIWRHRQRD